ncbi:hypothetical protein KAT08_03570 [Candidatus Babeliales bacterium]|nr:hypothetical protein [Candidatus Babeliales bacterium]
MNNNKSHKPISINLKIKISDKEFILGSLSLNLKTNEMSWHFNNAFKEKQNNLNTGENTQPVDHITFHRNITHIKLSKNKLTNYKQKPINPHSIPFLPSSRKFKIILVEEFVLNCSKNHCLSKESKFKSAKSQIVATFIKPIDFSLIIILIPNNYYTDHFIKESKIFCKNKELKFYSFVTSDYPIGKIICFKDFDLLIFIVPYTRDVSKIKKKPLDSFRIINYKNPLDSICKIFENSKKYI